MHPPGAVPLRISEENCTYTYQKMSRKKGGLGAKTATATARKGSVSKMIGLWKRCKITTALLKPKTALRMIIGGDRWPRLSLTLSLTQDCDPGANLLTPHPHCLPKMCVLQQGWLKPPLPPPPSGYFSKMETYKESILSLPTSKQ